MTDGQSDACRANGPFDSSTGLTNVKWLWEMRDKIIHGVPGMTIEEQRRCWEIAAGIKLPEPAKRCPTCLGDGCDNCGHRGTLASDDK